MKACLTKTSRQSSNLLRNFFEAQKACSHAHAGAGGAPVDLKEDFLSHLLPKYALRQILLLDKMTWEPPEVPYPSTGQIEYSHYELSKPSNLADSALLICAEKWSWISALLRVRNSQK